MKKAIFIAENNIEIKNLLSKNSFYKEGSKEVSLKIFGTEYYQLFPFVFERLPSFFLHSLLNVSICQFNYGPCKYNT
jgi:hypothetical protein